MINKKCKRLGGENIPGNIVLIACENRMHHCFGCAPCITGLKKKGDTVVALLSCGGPPGNSIVAQLNSINLWFKANNPTLLPLVPVYGKCISQCGKCKPLMDTLITSATKIGKIEEHEHPYSPRELLK